MRSPCRNVTGTDPGTTGARTRTRVPQRPSRGRRSRGDGALGHALGCWSPTADRVALTVLPDDVAIGAGAVEVPPGTPWSGATGP